MDFGVYLVH